MKRTRLPIILFLLVIVACSTSKTLTGSTDPDGLTVQNAIIVKSIDEEYKWIEDNYPGAKVTGQALIKRKGKPYDLLTITTSEGETREIYFDISKFFGKF